MNVQILVLPDGRLVWASDPYPGSMHDVAAPGAFRAAGGVWTPPGGSATRDTWEGG